MINTGDIRRSKNKRRISENKKRSTRNKIKSKNTRRKNNRKNIHRRNTHRKKMSRKRTRKVKGYTNRRYVPYKKWRGEHIRFDTGEKKVSKTKWRGNHTRFDTSSESLEDSPSYEVPAPVVLQRESEDPIMNAINKMFDDDPLMRTQSCHHSLGILGDALKMLGKTIEMIKEYPNIVGLQNSQNILEEITSYIKTSGHFILYMEGLYHFWLIEILDGKWRFLSQWGDEHDFLKYAESGKYGKFDDLESLSILEDDLSKYDEIPETIDKLKEIETKTNEIFLGSGNFSSYDLNRYSDSEIDGYLINNLWKPRIKKIFKIL